MSAANRTAPAISFVQLDGRALPLSLLESSLPKTPPRGRTAKAGQGAQPAKPGAWLKASRPLRRCARVRHPARFSLVEAAFMLADHDARARLVSCRAGRKRHACQRRFSCPLFPERVSLARVRPEQNEWRYYRMEVWPDLFGRALLVRNWGRIGTRAACVSIRTLMPVRLSTLWRRSSGQRRSVDTGCARSERRYFTVFLGATRHHLQHLMG